MKRRILQWFFCYTSLAGVFLGCRKEGFLRSVEADPQTVFNEAWTVISERYTLFSEKGVNWDSVRTAYEGRFIPGMPEQALFSELSRMLETLKDGHIALISPFDTSAYDGFYKGFPRNFTLSHVLDNYLVGDYQKLGPLLVAVREGVGYVYYGQFSESLSETQLDSLAKVMAGTNGLIIDVRGNQGGLLQAAERLASFLTAEPRQVKFEQYKSGPPRNAFGTPDPRTLSPFRDTYRHPVIVLTNRACFSACNDFVLYTTVFPNVKRYGDRTGGGGGVPSAYRLSNGWILQYSATRTLSVHLQSVEAGIIPEKEIQITVLDEARGKDPILEAAFLDLR